MNVNHGVIFLICCLVFSCNSRSTQKGAVGDQELVVHTPSQNSDCETEAMVKDFTGMDGCRFMFVLDNGDKLNPNEMPLMDFKLANNQKVKISYDIVKDGLSACMMEKHIIKVNCIELIGQTGGVKPVKTACVKVDNFSESKWLKSIAGEMKPIKVLRYTYLGDGWAYLLDNGLEKRLIDCQGTEICTIEGKAMNTCSIKIKSLGKGTTIYSTKAIRND